MSLTAQDLAAIKSIVDEAIDASKLQTAAGFAAVDARFEAIDARFESIDARFEAIDARFESVDARFDRMEARFDRMEQIQSAEVLRADRHGSAIARLNRELGLL